MNHLAKISYETALRREQITTDNSNIHDESGDAIFREFSEYHYASETESSEHLPQYSEAAEELADILIVCLTELYRRGVNVEKIITDKIEYNKTRQ